MRMVDEKVYISGNLHIWRSLAPVIPKETDTPSIVSMTREIIEEYKRVFDGYKVALPLCRMCEVFWMGY